MSRQYNSRISEKANRSLARRAHVVRLEKSLIAVSIILFISLIIILGSTMHAFANSKDNTPVNKYYTSIKVESGDTLWSIANKYTEGTNIKTTDYIEEITELNNLGDSIHAGDYLVVAYYSKEVK